MDDIVSEQTGSILRVQFNRPTRKFLVHAGVRELGRDDPISGPGI
jgi:hypothetical protein